MHNIRPTLLTTKFLSVFSMALAFPVAGLAMPTVTGNVLTWPDNGWYQVQRADTFATVCEGSVSDTSSSSNGPCTIDSTNHIVINHSTGERFNNIRADNMPTSNPIAPVSAVTISGSTISWPDDGWYQVQNSDTFVTACEGGTSCDVAAGNYVVINHTTGERFENRSVGGSPSTGTPTTGTDVPSVKEVTVNGQMLSWPDDGWYQVQDALSYTTVCEGGRGCEVSPGDYVVINHTAGRRKAVNVAGATTGDNQEPSTTFTRVDFTITVPVYVSNSLQVRISFGDVESPAAYVVDESWAISTDLPADTQDNLVVTFVDRNGEIVLGTYETSYTTGTSVSETIEVNASQFDTARWDDDTDGVSNLAESLIGSDPLVAGTDGQATTRVNFGINVPAYMSDELQVQVVWGDTVIDASWNGDEFWSAFADLPSDVEQPLTVIFYDRNGAIELGSYETTLRTGTNESEYIQYEQDQISTNRFDDDLDGRSNYAELGGGSDPLVSNPLVPVTFASVQSVLSGRCSNCHSNYRGGITHERLLELESRDDTPYIIPFEPELSRLVQRFEGRFPHVGVSNRSTFPQLLRAWVATGALDN